MKMTGQITRFYTGVFLTSWLLTFCLTALQAPAQNYSACQQIFTNGNQLAGVFGCDTFSIPSDPLQNRAWLIDPQFLWADFACLPEDFGTAFVQSQDQLQGLTIVKVHLTRFLLSGETLIEFPATTNTLVLDAPTGYTTNQVDSASRSALWTWRQWITWGEIDANTTPTLSLDVPLANVQDKSAYDAAIAAEDAACAEASTIASLASMEMLDSEDSDSGGNSLLLLSQDGTPCNASKYNKLQVQGTNFFLEWFSITNATYEIASATDITTPSSNWVSLASLYPAATGTNLTSFLDVGGATNKAKFYKVAKTGISIALCDSNTFSGIVDIPVEIGMPPGQELVGVSFLMDGQPTMSIINPSMSSGFKPSGTWSTLYVTNGWHTLQAVASYPDAAQHAFGGYSEYSSQVVTVQTYNAIVFPDFPTTFGTALPVTALLSSSNTDWTVNIRSPSNNVLHAFSGSTTNARIDVLWDGNNTNGVAFDGDFVYVEVTVSAGGLSPLGLGGMAAMVKVHKGPVGGFPSGFLVSYESYAFSGNTAGALGGFLTMVNGVDDVITAGPYELSGPNSGPNAVDDNASSWSAWKGWLNDGNTANLYHFGHAGLNGVGIQPSVHRGVFNDELGGYLINGFLAGELVMRHPYRFVFLDGCEAGNGDFCVAVGIDKKQTTAAQYAQRGFPTRAFLGWKYREQYIETNGTGDFSHYHANMITSFFNKWSNGEALKNAINESTHQGSLLVNTPIIWGDDQLMWNP